MGGADLRTVRGHAPRPPPWRAPREATQRLVAGEGSATDIAVVNEWNESRPAWLNVGDPFDLSMDTAAAISQVGLPISQWGHVHFQARPYGEPWTMTVTPKVHMAKDGTVRTHAYDVTVDIPGGGAKDTTGAREVLDLLSEREIDYDVAGTV